MLHVEIRPPGVKPTPPAVKGSLNPWTTREVLQISLRKDIVIWTYQSCKSLRKTTLGTLKPLIMVTVH